MASSGAAPGTMDPGAPVHPDSPRFIEGYPKPAKRRRFGEPFKFFPVIFVVGTIISLYCIYVFCHCVPLLQLWTPAGQVDTSRRFRAQCELAVFHFLTFMLAICYVRSVLTHPGQIPDHDPQWEYIPQDGRGPQEPIPMSVQEQKKGGGRRHCKWCGKFKPDRCHHCRVCKTCILKMDHHCPWIYNCVGFYNYKYFFLLLWYSMLDCHLIIWTMAESVQWAFMQDPELHHMFFLFFGWILAFFLGVLVTLFFGFHIWLMMKAMTTIEFCEKSLPKADGCESKGYDSSLYDLGYMGNARSVLGNNLLLWPLPFAFAMPGGDGLDFVSDETKLTMDIDAAAGMRRKTHQKTQRTRLHADIGGYDHFVAANASYYTGYDLLSDRGYGSTGGGNYGATSYGPGSPRSYPAFGGADYQPAEPAP
eukprot:TRINITY_DN120720_c0_g1_i1.p1 TRINITY_DN120720_c0_g1~~TRINITY_DN120720_c0_g1_i1.p1  ORF type:complete len:419 (+),score=53.61 TRINITY_DN120720_c0_g1_i1:201-1457(+)